MTEVLIDEYPPFSLFMILPTIAFCGIILYTGFYAYYMALSFIPFAVMALLNQSVRSFKKIYRSERLARIGLYLITFVIFYGYSFYLEHGRVLVQTELVEKVENYYKVHNVYPPQGWLQEQQNDYLKYQVRVYYHLYDPNVYSLFMRNEMRYEWRYTSESKEWLLGFLD